ncbi:HlyD family efflux transporter periplasmic adaptor subunit [Crenothrix polyspora]|uniref:Putative HlyD family secretion protein n=1 Tax=Crenothrix polyspora TaxID=360316 RepID=A0A1R4H5D3_9GAMM|nr:HlyD family secretion protein [Crenothrix polyspora]SJM91376.1 putative HlyD family secretion protein [Crenothrix polyspora]
MKRTFVFLVIALTHTQFSYSESETTPFSTDIPDLSSEADKSALLLQHAQIQIKQGILITSEMPGHIKNFTLGNNEHFVAGQVLANIDCPKETSHLKKVNLILNDRAKIKQQLEAAHSINTLEIDLVNAEYKIAQADARVAKAWVDRCVVYAPFAGKIVKLLAKSSQVLRTGDNLMEIMDDNQEVELLIQSNQMPFIKVGQSYQVNHNATAKPYTITLTSLGGKVDPGSQMITVHGRITENTGNATPKTDSIVALVSQPN